MCQDENLIGVVYKITNLINNKAYIGITTVGVEYRWKQHIHAAYYIKGSDSKSPFKKAIRKYGPKNFIVEIIDKEYNSLENLKQKEIKWIDYYHTCCVDPDGWGYNCTRGGDYTDERIKIPVAQCDIIQGKIIKVFASIRDAERDLGLRICSISVPNATAGGYCWIYLSDIEEKTDSEIYNYIHDLYPMLVYQLDEHGEIVNIYKDAQQAKKSVGAASAGNIISCCLGKRRQAMGYQWCYHKDLSIRLHKDMKDFVPFHIPIVQYGLNGIKIKTWNSGSEASQILHISDSHISSCCNGKRQSAGGYQWRYESDNIEQLPEITHKRPVRCIETQEIFKTPYDAAKHFGYSQQTVKDCCVKGRTTKPYHFEWAD